MSVPLPQQQLDPLAPVDGGVPPAGNALPPAPVLNLGLAPVPVSQPSPNVPVHLFDLSEVDSNSIGFSVDYWSKNMSKDVGSRLITLSPLHAMVTLIVYSDTPDHTLDLFLSELSAQKLKELCKHLQIEVPPKGSSESNEYKSVRPPPQPLHLLLILLNFIFFDLAILSPLSVGINFLELDPHE